MAQAVGFCAGRNRTLLSVRPCRAGLVLKPGLRSQQHLLSLSTLLPLLWKETGGSPVQSEPIVMRCESLNAVRISPEESALHHGWSLWDEALQGLLWPCLLVASCENTF